MNKKDFKKVLKEKINYSEDKVTIILDILDEHFIIGKNNKEKIVNDLIEKLNIDEEEANNVYNETMTIIKDNLKNKLKHPFKSLN